MPRAGAARLWRDNFAELKGPLGREEARAEASRCLYCYDAPCVTACPTHIDVPRFIRQIASDDAAGAGRAILEANALGHSCARVCPVEVLCEGACVYTGWQEKPIAIARLQRHGTDALLKEDAAPFPPGPPSGLKVAVVGAGPAGLACAAYLRRLGAEVSVFEKSPVPGGLNSHGVAEYKMERKTAAAEARRLLRGIKTSRREIRPADAPGLLSRFDAVFLGAGLLGGRRLGVPGEDLPGVLDALDFIARVKARDPRLPGSSLATVVIGGGNTAVDAATQSVRTGAAEVVMAYRRGPEKLSAYPFELALARTDGVRVLTDAAPVRVLGRKRAEGVEFRGPGGKIFAVACDRVLKAIGQEKGRALAEAFGVRLDEEGRLAANPETLATSNPKVFAGGDAVNGGKEVVNAAADGKRAAWGIWRALRPGAPPPPGNDYWISTIGVRRVAPIAPRGQEEHG